MISIQLQKKLDAANGEMNLQVDLKINRGDFLSISGPSGAGKTSLLQMISGLMKPDAGRISVDDTLWLDTKEKYSLKIQKRPIAYVFQQYTLFPNMNVEQNLKFALDKSADTSIIEELLHVTDLQQLRKRMPTTLSGGQKQRVALARALVRKPKVLLLDEPLSALDQEMRAQMQDYLIELHKKYALTTILVTHDIGEIFKLSNRTIKLDQGRILEDGSPAQIFSNNNLSAKFRFQGRVLSIEKNGLVYIVLVQVQSQIIRVIATDEDLLDISIGDVVLIASKAFNPVIKKIKL